MSAEGGEADDLFEAARELGDEFHGRVVSFSRKVFLPLTNLCRDYCEYCTFRKDPGDPRSRVMEPAEVLAEIGRAESLGCREALFSLGDKPEAVFPEMKRRLAGFGHSSTLEYLADTCERVLEETLLLPHSNPGLMSTSVLERLRRTNASVGLMLECISERLMKPGMPHHRAPDKAPRSRMAVIEAAGRLGIPFTTGILIGIGETLPERVDSLLAIRGAHERFGHIQEVIIQNFRAKPGTPMQDHSEPDFDDLIRTAAVARLILGGEINIQVPPNLSGDEFPRLLEAGINDWGGISPFTPDYINPEAPWPHLQELKARTEAAGFQLRERLAVYPEFTEQAARGSGRLKMRLSELADGDGYRKDGQ
jgi:FO synthase